ncbi:MAG: GDSL-type esterase/lipase family protein [Anaerolineae bacterium]
MLKATPCCQATLCEPGQCLSHGQRAAGSHSVINMGVGGNTVRDLAARWESDVTALNPDWLSICIGINDVWRQFDARLGGRRLSRSMSATRSKI